jgi:hypothetical protein
MYPAEASVKHDMCERNGRQDMKPIQTAQIMLSNISLLTNIEGCLHIFHYENLAPSGGI